MSGKMLGRCGVLSVLGALALACASAPPAASAPSAPKAPDWVQGVPAPDAKYTYFVGAADAAAGDEAAAADSASAGMVAEIMRYMGVTVNSTSTATAQASLDSFRAGLVQTVKETSSGRISGFIVKDRYVAKRSSGVTVYLLGAFETAALEAERSRLAGLLKEKADAVAKPEAEAKALLAAGDPAGAVRKFLEAAAAAAKGDVDNGAIKTERNLNAAKDAVSRLSVDKLGDNLSGAPGVPFAEPFRVAVKFDGAPVAKVPFLVSFQAKLSNGRLGVKTATVFSGADGLVGFVHPAPDFVGKASFIARLDLNAALALLGDLPDRYAAARAALEDEIALKKASVAYSVVSGARKVPTAVYVADLDASGASAGSATGNALVSALAGAGFSVSAAALGPDAVVGKDDAAVLAAAKGAVGAGTQRLVFGVARLVSVKDDSGQKVATVSVDLKALDLASGRVLYAATKQASAVAATEKAAVDSARRQLGQKTLGDDLAASLP